MSKNKNIFFNFFRSTTYDKQNEVNNRLDLQSLLERLRNTYREGEEKELTDYKVLYTYNDEPAILTKITFDEY